MSLAQSGLATAIAGAVALLAAPLGAQSIEGDVYLALNSGQTVKITANTVALVPGDSALADVRKLCRIDEPDSLTMLTSQTKGFPDEATRKTIARLSNTLWARNDSVSSALRRRVLRTSPTGLAAHYKIDSIPPGSYALWAEGQLSGRPYAWLVPITLTNGQRKTVDLDNSNVINGAMYCYRAKT